MHFLLFSSRQGTEIQEREAPIAHRDPAAGHPLYQLPRRTPDEKEAGRTAVDGRRDRGHPAGGAKLR